MIKAKINWNIILYMLLIGVLSGAATIAVDWMSCRDEHTDFGTWLSKIMRRQK